MKEIGFGIFLFWILLSSELSDAKKVQKFRHKACAESWEYDGNQYNYCTTKNSPLPWCSTGKKYDKLKRNFVYCFPTSCVFPFEYSDKLHNTCIGGRMWCSKVRKYLIDKREYFEYCDDVTVTEEDMSDDCPIINGKQMELEDIWYKDCVYYKCTRDKVVTLKDSRCFNGTTCHNIGSVQFPCTHNNQLYKECNCTGTTDNPILVPTIMCDDPDGPQIRRLGDIWVHPTKPCQTYTCLKSGTQLDKKCSNEGICKPIGESNFSCKIGEQKYKHCSCEATDSDPQLKPAVSCTAESKTFNRGTTWMDKTNCSTFECQDEEKWVEISKGCLVGTECKPIGPEIFKCEVLNTPYNKCICEEKDNKATLKPLPSCTDGNITYDAGKTWEDKSDKTMCVLKKCVGENKTEDVSKSCLVNGECKASGTSDFPCEINNVKHPKCSCVEGKLSPQL